MKAFIILFMAIMLVGCENATDKAQRIATDIMVSEANAIHGMPDITRFTEKGILKNIIELRDEEITTYAYLIDMNGGAHFLCNSIGYGMPFGAQYVSPEKNAKYRGEIVKNPQPEPNGIYMPTSSESTWITCSVGGKREVVYVEPPLVVSPFELRSDPMR